jgi:hypothetical protein
METQSLKTMREMARDEMRAVNEARRTAEALYDTEEQLMEAHAEIARLKSICLSMGWNNGSN